MNGAKSFNILIVSQYFWPENFRINDFATALVDRGHHVTVLTGKPNYPEGKLFEGYRIWGGETESYQGVKVIRVPLITRGKGRGARLALNYFSFAFFGIFFGVPQVMNKKFDLVFAHQLSPVTLCLPAIAIKWLKRIPFCMWVQDLWPESLEATGAIKSKKIISVVGRLVDFIYNQCDRIFVQSKGFVGAIEKRGVNRNKIYYMPNWAEDIFSNGDSEQPVPALSGEFKILFAGNIGEAQDFPTILQAAEKLRADPRIQWYILGNGRKKEWVQREIINRNLEKCVYLLGQYRLEAMPAFFNQADALLVSLKKELIFSLTIPSKVQSYLASGKPILACLDGEGSKVIQEANAGFTCAAEMPGDLVNCIVHLMAKSPEERKLMGKAGQNYFAKNFERNLVISSFENKISEMLS